MISLRAAADMNRRRKRKAMLAAIVEHGFGVQGRVGPLADAAARARAVV